MSHHADTPARVVILGWHDATPRHLRAVARMHEARGHLVETILSESGKALGRPHGFRDLGRRLADTLARTHEARPLPLVFHSFSNAGFWTLAALLDAARSEHPFFADAHRATILDSAPGFPESIPFTFTARTAPMAFLPGLLARIGRPPAHHDRWLGPPLAALFGLWHLAAPTQVRFMERSSEVVRSAHRPSAEHPARPLLAVWGGADMLVEARYVESFLSRCEGDAIPIERLYFPTSAHVRHFVAHRAAYERATHAFLTGSLTRS